MLAFVRFSCHGVLLEQQKSDEGISFCLLLMNTDYIFMCELYFLTTNTNNLRRTT